MRAIGSCCATACALSCGLSACGGTSPSSVVIRVGDTPITKATVDRWTRAVARGGAFTGFRGQPARGTPRQRALALLISSYWLIGEAAREGMPVSKQALASALGERVPVAHGPELSAQLGSRGQSTAGMKLEVEAELAFVALREALEEQEESISQAQLVGYYERNRSAFSTPEVRVTDIVEGLPSSAAATSLVRRVGTDTGFHKLASHKKVARTPGVLQGPAAKKALDYAIYAAKPGVVSAPMPLDGAWSVFVVRRVIQPHLRALKDVEEEVAAGVRTQRKLALVSAFDRSYRSRWKRQTRCQSAYLAPGCERYRGVLGTYEDPFAR